MKEKIAIHCSVYDILKSLDQANIQWDARACILLERLLKKAKIKAKAYYEKDMEEIPVVQCICCNAKSADCVYGTLRGSQSCIDTRTRYNMAMARYNMEDTKAWSWENADPNSTVTIAKKDLKLLKG